MFKKFRVFSLEQLASAIRIRTSAYAPITPLHLKAHLQPYHCGHKFASTVRYRFPSPNSLLKIICKSFKTPAVLIAGSHWPLLIRFLILVLDAVQVEFYFKF